MADLGDVLTRRTQGGPQVPWRACSGAFGHPGIIGHFEELELKTARGNTSTTF